MLYEGELSKLLGSKGAFTLQKDYTDVSEILKIQRLTVEILSLPLACGKEFMLYYSEF